MPLGKAAWRAGGALHGALLALVATAALAACGANEPQRKSVSVGAAVPVQAVAVTSQEWPEVYEATGTVRARTAATISSRVMAYVREVAVHVGDSVREGQLLVTLDSQDLETNVRKAEAAEAEVKSAIPEADNGVAAAKANLDLAQSTYRRIAELESKKSVTDQEFDEASARLKGAQAAYDMARARRGQLDPKLARAQQEVRAASIMRDYARISAPFAGVVTEKPVEPGNLATPGAPLITLEREGDFRLEASVDETKLPAVKTGENVEVSLDALGSRFGARVSEIVPAVDPASRSYTVKIDLPAVVNLKSGIFGRAYFPMGMRKALTIPAAALAEHGQLQTVFVIEDGAARARLVTTGARGPNGVEALSGVNEGEKVDQPNSRKSRGRRSRGGPVMATRALGPAGRFARAWISSKLTPLIIAAALLVGAFAVWRLPREEEPQIVVPMIDVLVQMPGASAREVEERVTKPMEKLLWEVPGVEYIYSTSSPGRSMAIVRFYVGQDEEKAIVRLNQKLYANFDLIPPGASQPLVKPRSIDDVPILALTLSSKRYGDFELRQIASQVHDTIKQTPDVSAVTLIGGQKREVRIVLDAAKLAAYNLSPLQVAGALGLSNRRLPSGQFDAANREYLLETGEFLTSAEDVRNVVAGVANDKPVFVRDLAEAIDGGEEPSQYVRMVRAGTREFLPAVTIAIAKRKGTNAVEVAENVLQRVEGLKGSVIPADVQVDITRNYGETAAEKSNELLFHMLIAVVSVSILIAITLGFRESLIVFVAIPVTLALTLAVFYLYGYTLNRITLFALIFSIGILVDDAIVVVENIVRHWRMPANRGRPPNEVAIEAVDEVGNPTILATLTVVAAILPMAFVGGLMGPYMRPIPIGASAAIVFSLLVAFMVTPWAAVRILRKTDAGDRLEQESLPTRIYRRVMGKLLHVPALRWGFLLGVVALLLGSVSLFYFQYVKVKMLPFDNKSEFQVIVDMPNGTTLEETQRAAGALARATLEQPEVVNLQTYAGAASPFNFNGLVRHYYLRQGSNVADIQVNLLSKGDRKLQSHEIAKQVRDRLLPVANRYGARIKVAEVPPGPPVLETLVAEVYGPDLNERIAIARRIRDLWKNTNGVVDVDWYVEDDQPKYRLVVDKEKAALSGVSESDIAQTLAMASSGYQAGLLHVDSAKEDIPLTLRLARASRSDLKQLEALKVMGRTGKLVALGELVHAEESVEDKSIYHKNLLPVTYVTGDVAGAMESPVYAILRLGPRMDKFQAPGGYAIERHMAALPTDSEHYSMKWDGEWHITYEVFRDLGIAFAAVLILIYGLVVGWFQSFITPLVIMAAIPFSLVGILPAHGLLHAFFTATSMIGFIAGAGIVVRNSIILVDFIELRLKEGMPLDEAVIDAGAVRFRPMMLTAAAVVVGAGVILFDPIFQGLAIALMAGEVASLALSRMTVPIVYFVVNRRRSIA